MLSYLGKEVINMYDVSVNYLAVAVAAIAAMVVGYIWYGMSAFGRPWMTAIGKTEEQIKADYKPTAMVWTYLFALITAFVLAHFISLIGASNLQDAIMVAVWAWVGFVATVIAMNGIYEGRPSSLFWINSLYQLVTLVVMAIIIFSWK